MEIVLNGDAKEIDEHSTVSQLVDKLGLAGQRYAIEINLEIIPRSQHATHPLKSGDRVEIVHAIGGG